MNRLLVSGLVLLAGLQGSAAADTKDYDRNWPQWRGPRATGVAPLGDPPVEWGESRNVLWTAEIPGSGLSTPIVWQDRVFLTAAVKTDERIDPKQVEAAERDLPDWRRASGISPVWVLRFQVLALDRATGEVVWSKTVRRAAPHEGLHTDASWASASPATDGEILIAHFGSNGTYALDLDGNLKWERDLGDMQTRRAFGEGSSPVIHGDSVVINWDHEGDSFVVALDRKTGETRWKTDRDEITSWSTPIVAVHGEKAQVVISATGRTRGYDLATGKALWEAGGMTTNTIPSPLYDGRGRVFVTSGFRGNMLQAIDLSAARGDVTDGEAVAWKYEQDTPYVPSPMLYGNLIYFLKQNTGILSVLDANSGEPVYTRQRLEGIEGAYASIVGAEERVYVVGRNGVTQVLAHGAEYRLLASNRLDDDFDASPATAGEQLFLRGRRRVYCLSSAPREP